MALELRRDPSAGRACAFPSPLDYAAQIPGVFCGIRKFQCARMQQQRLPVRSVFTDSTVPTPNFAGNEIAPCQENAARPDAKPQGASAASGDHLGAESTSESGWTAYLDLSVNTHNSYSKRLKRSGNDERDCGGISQGDDDYREDSSMESDASSGPEQPEFRRKKRRAQREKRVSVAKKRDLHCVREEDLDDTCQSNLSCESVSDDPGAASRQFKRMKVGEDHQPAVSQAGDEHSDENEVKVEAEEAEICSPPSVHVQREYVVDSRLELLHDSITHSRKLDENDQVLEAAVECSAKSLEEKIKMFEARLGDSKRSSSEHQSAESITTSQTCQAASALQDKGPCACVRCPW